jgi:hypothetical protein
MTDLHEAPVRTRPRAPATDEPADYRQPPQDLNAEQSVLGGMLLSNADFRVVDSGQSPVVGAGS